VTWLLLQEEKNTPETRKTAIRVGAGLELGGWHKDTPQTVFRKMYAVDNGSKGTVGLLVTLDDERKVSIQIAWRREIEGALTEGYTAKHPKVVEELRKLVCQKFKVQESGLGPLVIENKGTNYTGVVYIILPNETEFAGYLEGATLKPIESFVIK